MAEEKKKKNGITFEERVRRSMGTQFGKKKAEQIIKKDKEKGNDPTRIVARPPKRGPDLPKQGVTTVPKIAKEAKNIAFQLVLPFNLYYFITNFSVQFVMFSVLFR